MCMLRLKLLGHYLYLVQVNGKALNQGRGGNRAIAPRFFKHI